MERDNGRNVTHTQTHVTQIIAGPTLLHCSPPPPNQTPPAEEEAFPFLELVRSPNYQEDPCTTCFAFDLHSGVLKGQAFGAAAPPGTEAVEGVGCCHAPTQTLFVFRPADGRDSLGGVSG